MLLAGAAAAWSRCSLWATMRPTGSASTCAATRAPASTWSEGARPVCAEHGMGSSLDWPWYLLLSFPALMNATRWSCHVRNCFWHECCVEDNFRCSPDTHCWSPPHACGPVRHHASWRWVWPWGPACCSCMAAAARLHAHRLSPRYLLLEFPALKRTDPPPRVVELGCGVGSSLLPVLKANPGARVIATDVSPAAVCRLSGY